MNFKGKSKISILSGFLKKTINEVQKHADVNSLSEKIQSNAKKLEKKIDQYTQNQVKDTEKENKSVQPKPSKLYKTEEVGIIVKFPDMLQDSKVFDLSGNRVYRITKTMREKSFRNKTYLGQKELKSGVLKWVEVDPNEVNDKLNDKDFIKKHSVHKEKVNKFSYAFEDLVEDLIINQKLVENWDSVEEKYVQLNLSIVRENFLNNIPMSLNFSNNLEITLSSNQDELSEIKINKLTRFLTFIESKEELYKACYDQGCRVYNSDPKNHIFLRISDLYCIIIYYYQIFMLMLKTFKTNKVLFNKLYNLIEDEGIFLSKSEKETISYLKSIASGIQQINENLIDGFGRINSHLEKINLNIEYTLGELGDISSELNMVNNSLLDIYNEV